MSNKQIAAVAFILVVAAAWMFVKPGQANAISAANSQAQGTTPSVTSDSNTVKIPLSEVSASMRKYTENLDGASVRYIVVLGSDGQPRTAFDACEVCGGAKGYRQEGSELVCNNCGKAFRVDDLGAKNTAGGCWPVNLPHKVEGGYVVIAKSDLSAGKRYF
ncbi:Uncharacterised protein [uncultured archaeon]|nr:Uncharacterised protein [uncultured archaeon]